MVYTPPAPISAKCDLNLFLARSKLVHSSIPQLPLSLAHCWINAELEVQKLKQNQTGPNPKEVRHLSCKSKVGC
jgi:hypothetical protein